MLGFSNRQPGAHGPHRLTFEDITGAFIEGWRIGSIEPATIEVTVGRHGIAAWLARVTRT